MIGGDLGGAVKGFRKAMDDGEQDGTQQISSDKPDADFSSSDVEQRDREQ